MNDKHNHLSVRGHSELVRPQYSQGLMLQDDDLTQAVDYSRGLNQLLFRSLLGCGVVCGLEVKLHDDGCATTISISSGLALDGSGLPIHVHEGQTLKLGGHCDDLSKPRWIVVRRHEHLSSPRGLACNPEDDAHSTVYTRLRDGFEITMVGGEGREGACGCKVPEKGEGNDAARAKCFEHHLHGDCDCCCSATWVVLGYFANIEEARKLPEAGKDGVSADYRVRKFIRPALLPDPLWTPAAAALEDAFKLISTVAEANDASAGAAASLADAANALAAVLAVTPNVDKKAMEAANGVAKTAAISAANAAKGAKAAVDAVKAATAFARPTP